MSAPTRDEIEAALNFLFRSDPDHTPDYEALGFDTSDVQYGGSYPSQRAAKSRCLEILLLALSQDKPK